MGLHTLQLVSPSGVQTPLSRASRACLCVSVVFEIYMLYRTCPLWHLHVCLFVCSTRTLVGSHLVFTLEKKMAAREVGGQRSRGGRSGGVGSGGGRCPGHALVILL